MSDIHTQLEQIREQLAVLNKLLTGNGDPSKGIVVRLDRIEQQNKRWSWTLKAVGAAVIGLIVKIVFKF